MTGGGALDLSAPRRLHLVGVAGTGMSAYASVLAEAGHRVTGSDAAPDRAVAGRLRALGVVVHEGHDAAFLPPDAEVLAASTAVAPDNPELVEARRRGLPVLRRADLLAALCSQRRTLAVAGTHGKTTTTALLALALRGAGLSPSFVVGADVPSLDHGAHWDVGGDLMVAEADESDGTFLHLPRALAVVTNVEADHLATYGGSVENLRAAFRRFVAETPGPVVLGVDDPGAASLVDGCPAAVTFGTGPGASFRVTDLVAERMRTRFHLRHAGGTTPVDLPTPGLHNALNAAAAVAAAASMGADPDRAAAALAAYGGVLRRFQWRGERDGIAFVDDYAHLPSEVRAALAAARRGGWKRIVAVFQPHRFSRTEEVHAEFAGAFDDADVLVVGGIYTAGEPPRPGVTGRLVADASGHPSRTYVEERADLAAAVRPLLRSGDLCLTLGAGDITTLPDELAELPGDRYRQGHLSLGSSPGGWGRGAVLDEVAGRLGPLVRRDVPLGPLTTYRVGGPAALLARCGTDEELQQVAAAVAATGVPTLVVGKGSNLLVADRGFAGLVVALTGRFEEIDMESGRPSVTAGAAVALPALARRTAAAGLTGFEWAVGVPGSVGGAVRMNAGGHGSDMAASVVSVDVVDLAAGTAQTVPAADLGFGYRSSRVTSAQVVVRVRLGLAEGDAATAKEAIDEIVRWRRQHQPGGQNAGSVFTNPPGDSAGRLVDAAGGRGIRIGTASVAEKHANFVQADEGGRAGDVLAVIRAVRRLVHEHGGVVLHPELRLAGFADEDLAGVVGEVLP